MPAEREVLEMKKRKMRDMMMRRAFCNVMAIAMVFSSLVLPQGAITAYAEDGGQTPAAITVTASAISSYKATQIKNGDFEEIPWQDFVLNGVKYTGAGTSVSSKIDFSIPNGVGEGWNTTEIQPYKGNLFEVWPSASPLADSEKGRDFTGNGDRFIEMNTTNPAALYQDLPTQGGDVIKWTLQHAARNGNGCDPQSMYVTIGAPKRGTNGEILAASGVNTSIDPKIQDTGKAEYRSSGVTAASGNATCVSGSSMSGLSVGKNDKTWHEVAGIYVVPEGQDVTRFAFCADSSGDSSLLSYGNFLDNITFSTLFGNLKATEQENGDIQISGYWGESDSSKKLVVELAENEKEYLDMSGVCNSNFTIDIPKSVIGESKSVKVYHQDYETATKPVPVTHKHSWNYVSGTGGDTNKIYAYCSATSGSACSYQGAANKKIPMTLTAANATYNGSAYSGARVSTWPLADDNLAPKPKIKYYCLSGEEETETNESNSGAASSGAAPKNVGRYRAQIQIGEAIATADFSINKLGINSVSFTEPTTTPGSSQAASLTTAANAYYTGSISWAPSEGTFGYNKSYTATVTLTLKDSVNCEFANSVTCANKDWSVQSPLGDGTLVLAKTYTTAMAKINSVTAPDVTTQLTEFTTETAQISAFPATVAVAVQDNAKTSMAIVWQLKPDTTYSGNSEAENTFVWTVKSDEYANYDTNGQTLTGEVTIKNPVHTHNWSYEAQGNQLTAYCTKGGTQGCPYDSEHKLTLTITAEDMSFTGNVYTGAAISDTEKGVWTGVGLTIPTIQYVGTSGTSYDISTTAPTAVQRLHFRLRPVAADQAVPAVPEADQAAAPAAVILAAVDPAAVVPVAAQAQAAPVPVVPVVRSPPHRQKTLRSR